MLRSANISEPCSVTGERERQGLTRWRDCLRLKKTRMQRRARFVCKVSDCVLLLCADSVSSCGSFVRSQLTYLLVFWSTHQSPASHHLTSRGQSGPCICRDGRLIDLRVHCARASTGGRVPPWGGVGLWWGSPLWASPPGARGSRVSEAPSFTRCYPLCLSFFRRSLASSILVVS